MGRVTAAHTRRVADQEGTFARLRLAGGRFESAVGMPVEALTELVAYRELVVGVAKEVFRGKNPHRQRLPRGFSERLQLRLQSVERGSAVPVLERVREPDSLLTAADDFTAARDIIEDAVGAISAGAPLPKSFPRDALVLFNRFGQTLRADESIELRRGMADVGPRFTKEIRQQLVLEDSSTYQDEVWVIGWVSEIDANRMSCTVRLRSGPPTPVQAPVDEVIFGPIKAALAPNGEGPPVRIHGVGVFDPVRGLIRLDSIHDVAPIEDPEDLAALDERFMELEELQKGWLDGEGIAPTTAALRRARITLAELLLRLEVPRPRLYPTPEGGVQAEWTSGDCEVSVTFLPDGLVFGVAVDTVSGESEELADADGEQLARFVMRAS